MTGMFVEYGYIFAIIGFLEVSIINLEELWFLLLFSRSNVQGKFALKNNMLLP